MNTSNLDLSNVQFVDNHAHALTREQPATAGAFRNHFCEAHSPLLGRNFVGSAVHFQWALTQIAGLLDVEPTEDAIIEFRDAMGIQPYAALLVRAARVAHLILDEGYPPPDTGYTLPQMQEMLRVPVSRIVRIETALQDLLLTCDSWSEVVDGFDVLLDSAIRDGCVGLKSIAAYRTGLAIEPVSEDAAQAAFGPVHEEAKRLGKLRLADKTLIDFFVWQAARVAAAHNLPFQFHTGYGDPDLDLRLANPLHLRPLFEDRSLEAAPIVLLHGSYPYTAEAAYLAAAYPNAFMDIAFSLPPLGRFELERALHIALGVAPAGKIMCSSDGTAIPEHYWLGATRARLCLERVLQELVEVGDLSPASAAEIGAMCLHDNARLLYRLT